MSKLGQRLTGGSPPARSPEAKATPLRSRLVNGRRGEEVNVAGLGRIWMELPGDRTFIEIEAAVQGEMRKLGVGELNLISQSSYESEKARRVLAESCKDPDNKAEPYGTLAEWNELDSQTINIAWHAWGDLVERLDPMSTQLTEDEAIAIQAAVKKKDASLLRSFGAARLSLWLATTADPPSTSPAPSSPSGESSSDD